MYTCCACTCILCPLGTGVAPTRTSPACPELWRDDCGGLGAKELPGVNGAPPAAEMGKQLSVTRRKSS
eukprot:scaffold76258_cov20-Tisochrysis_lutea.AAC.1